ncbi:MAG: hypothetical protein M5U14_13865 [Acidimicrobiia bacterium]|nr:hypothetical protein [Acidimicrobiia bacterium]
MLSAGRPVLVEKPLTEDLAQTQTLVAEARRSGAPLMCSLLEAFNPAVCTAWPSSRPVHVTAVRHSPYVARIQSGVGYDLPHPRRRPGAADRRVAAGHDAGPVRLVPPGVPSRCRGPRRGPPRVRRRAGGVAVGELGGPAEGPGRSRSTRSTSRSRSTWSART